MRLASLCRANKSSDKTFSLAAERADSDLHCLTRQDSNSNNYNNRASIPGIPWFAIMYTAFRIRLLGTYFNILSSCYTRKDIK